ncbi:MAG: FHA domain-containing protein [Planctomycetes bacterium]|nr:FHA domain-containing protein [Planctomycetota bacterium]
MPPPRNTIWIIGSAAGCDLRVTSPYVSSRHCRLVHEQGRWTLEDLGSTNGTFVNGIRLMGTLVVSPTDRITLGSSEPLPWPAPPAAPIGTTTTATTLPLPAGRRPLVIGRSAGCDVVLDQPMVSGRHAILETDGEGWRIRDLGSTNGTFVDGRRIDGPQRVAAGAVIGLGSHRLLLTTEGPRLEGRSSAVRSVLEARDIAVDAGGRRLIEHVSLAVSAGELVAIMGPSGAGKSTLLATLVGGLEPDAGTVLVSGADLSARYDEFRGQIGYVPQDDIMHAELTVSQALWFAARLRLPRDYADDEIRRRTDAVMGDLGLTGAEHVRIGSADRRGISGGQRKRVNVAMELITDPPILVLDEPTSGLSSTDALVLITLLRGLADAGKTVVLTIHQPGPDVLRQMDGLVVIARDASSRDVGQLVWFGPPLPDAASFFEPHGQGADPEAILRGLASRPVADWRAAFHRSETYRTWVDGRRSVPVAVTSPRPRRGASPLDALSQWWTLVRRSVTIKVADRWTTAILLAQAPIIGLLVAGVFGGRASGPLDHESWAELARAVATTTFLMALAAIWFGCSNAAREIVVERAILRRERMVGLSLTAYLASKLLVLAVLCGLQCWLLLSIVGRGCGLQASFGGTWLTLFLAANVAAVIGLCLSAVARSAEAAASLLPLVILPMVILGGILLPLPELPRVTTYLADAIPSRWAFEGLFVPEADARATLEFPPGDPTRTDEPRVEDLAEPWFPRQDWRSSRDTPDWMLAGMWAIGVVALERLLRHGEHRCDR